MLCAHCVTGTCVVCPLCVTGTCRVVCPLWVTGTCRVVCPLWVTGTCRVVCPLWVTGKCVVCPLLVAETCCVVTSVSRQITSSTLSLMVNDELESVRLETAITAITAITYSKRNLPGGTDKYHGRPQSRWLVSRRYVNLRPFGAFLIFRCLLNAGPYWDSSNEGHHQFLPFAIANSTLATTVQLDIHLT